MAAFQHPFNAYYLALPLNPDSITDAHSLLEKFYNSLSQSIYQLLRTATPVPLHFV